MGIATFTKQDRTTIKQTTLSDAYDTLQPLLLQGKIEEANRALLVLLDNGPDDIANILLKVIAALLRSNSVQARHLMEATRSLSVDEDRRYIYSLLLIESAICIALNNGDPAVTTIATAEASRELSTYSAESVGTQGVQIIHQLAEGNIGMARSTHGAMVKHWQITESPIIIQWIQVIDLAVYAATGDPEVLRRVLNSERPNPVILSQAREMERKFRRKARQPKWLNRAIGQALKKR